MTPFQEDLYRLIQDVRNSTSPFTSAEEDAGSDVQLIVKFSNKWDFKGNYDIKKKTSVGKKSSRGARKKGRKNFTGIFEHKALEKLGGSIAFVVKSKKFVWGDDEETK